MRWCHSRPYQDLSTSKMHIYYNYCSHFFRLTHYNCSKYWKMVLFFSNLFLSSRKFSIPFHSIPKVFIYNVKRKKLIRTCIPYKLPIIMLKLRFIRNISVNNASIFSANLWNENSMIICKLICKYYLTAEMVIIIISSYILYHIEMSTQTV